MVPFAIAQQPATTVATTTAATTAPPLQAVAAVAATVPTYALNRPNPYNLSVSYTLEWDDAASSSGGEYGASIRLNTSSGSISSSLAALYLIQFQLPDHTSRVLAWDEGQFRYAAIERRTTASTITPSDAAAATQVWHTFQPVKPLSNNGDGDGTLLLRLLRVNYDPRRPLNAKNALRGPTTLLLTFTTTKTTTASTTTTTTTTTATTNPPETQRAIFTVQQQYQSKSTPSDRPTDSSSNPAKDAKKVATAPPPDLPPSPPPPQNDEASADRPLPVELIGAIAGGVGLIGMIVVAIAIAMRNHRETNAHRRAAGPSLDL